MHTWKLKNAQHRLRELVRLALTREPQRVSNGRDAVVVIAASEYDRLRGAVPASRDEPHSRAPEAGTGRASPVPAKPAKLPEAASGRSAWDSIQEFRSQYDMDEVGWPFEWDCETRDWYLPEDRAVSP